MLALSLTFSSYLRKLFLCFIVGFLFFLVHRKGEKRRVVPRKTSAEVVHKAVILRSPTAEETRRQSTDRRGQIF